MAKKKNKQPLSLNECHNRLLQDLSASQTRPHSKPLSLPQEYERSKVNLDLYDYVPRFSGIADFDSPSPPVEMKSSEFEIERSEDDGDCENSTTLGEPEPNFSGITDFNSKMLIRTMKMIRVELQMMTQHFLVLLILTLPLPRRNVVERDTGGGNEIRDILNDLSSMLEFLSIEKKCAPKMVDLRGESLASVKDEVYNQAKKDDLLPSLKGTMKKMTTA